MNNDVPWYVSFIVAWLPFLLIWWMFTWLGRTIRKSLTTQDGRSLAHVLDDLGREVRRSNDLREARK